MNYASHRKAPRHLEIWKGFFLLFKHERNLLKQMQFFISVTVRGNLSWSYKNKSWLPLNTSPQTKDLK